MKIYILVEATYDYYKFLCNRAVNKDKQYLIDNWDKYSKYDYIDISKLSDKAKKQMMEDEVPHCYIEEWEV